MSRKIFVIDTSVLLYDKECFENLSGNDIVLPLTVLEELDQKKANPGVLGLAARHINKFLDSAREIEYDEDGWKYFEDIDIKLKYFGYLQSHHDIGDTSLDCTIPDNKILFCAINIAKLYPETEVILLTKDRNLRVKCDVAKLGGANIKAEDYYSDYIDIDLEKYKGHQRVDFVRYEVDQFYNDGYIDIPEVLEDQLNENYFINGVATDSNNSVFLGRCSNGRIIPLKHKEINITSKAKVKPLNLEQKYAVDALLDMDIPLVTITGLAGSGKTFLSLMAALSFVQRTAMSEELDREGLIKPKRIIVTRTLQQVGKKELGFLPGSIEDKMAPWLAPLLDNVRAKFDDPEYFSNLIENGDVEVVPIPYIRGRSFDNAIVIVDEAQNATIHELKTIVTRIGKNSKIILLGDIDQIDTPYINKNSNGLSIIIEKFKASKLSAHIHLQRGQRSALATEASKIL